MSVAEEKSVTEGGGQVRRRRRRRWSEARRACGRPSFIHALFERAGLPPPSHPSRKHPPKAAGYLGLSLVAAHFR